MNAREVIAAALRSYTEGEDAAEIVERILAEYGFTIMSKEDVEAVRAEAIAEYKAAIDSLKHVTDADLERVRDKALEEGCQSVGDPIKWHRALKSSKLRKRSDLAHFIAGAAQAAIRSLKSTS